MHAAETNTPCPAPARARPPLPRRADDRPYSPAATRPLRLANLAQLELGRELVRRGGGWRLELQGADTKTGEPLELPFPDELVPALEAYLATWPQLAQPRYVAASAALWLTHRGTAISDIHAYNNIVAHTRKAFGQAVNPHLFRDAAAPRSPSTAPSRCAWPHASWAIAASPPPSATTISRGPARPQAPGTSLHRLRG